MSGKLIGLGGLKEAGKDAIADHLVAEYGWVKMGMSDVLHEALLIIDPMIPTGVWTRGIPGVGPAVRYSSLVSQVGYVEAKQNHEVRRLLQMLGTEVGRKLIGENVWVDKARERIVAGLGESDVVMTGMRYKNELAMVRSLNGELWWADRPSVRAKGSTSKHDSENSVGPQDFDLVMDNSGALKDLYEKIDMVVPLD